MTTRKHILDIIKDHKKDFLQFGIRNIGIFGSFARNENTSNSDLDILIDFEPDKENFDNYMAVYDMLEQIFKNQKLDVVTKNGLSPYIGPKILNEVMYV
jgi:predicted nucleotidyltransferase